MSFKTFGSAFAALMVLAALALSSGANWFH